MVMQHNSGNHPPMRLASPDIIFETPPKWQGAVVAAAALAVFLIFANFGLEGAGRIAAVSVASIGGAMRIAWPLRNRLWFWVAMTCVVAIHVAIVALHPWSNERYPASMLIPVMVADIIAILCLLALLAKLLRGSSPHRL